MQKYFDFRLISFITPVLLFCFVFFTGCVTSGIESVESDDIDTDHKYIKHIYYIELISGKKYSDTDYNIKIELNKDREVQINCYPKHSADSVKNNRVKDFDKISLTDIKSAKVRFKNKPTLTGYIAGGLVLIGLIAFLFWANGERNKRK